MDQPSKEPVNPDRERERRMRFDRMMNRWLNLAPRLMIISLVALGIVGVAKIFLWDGKTTPSIQETPIAVQIVAVIIGLVATGLVFSNVLEGGFGGWLKRVFERPTASYQSELRRLLNEIDDARHEMLRATTTAAPSLTIEERRELVEAFRASARAAAAQEFIAELRSHVMESSCREIIKQATEQTLERLRLERSRTARRGNFNLFIGLLTTVAGVWLLITYASELSPVLMPPSGSAVVAKSTTAPQSIHRATTTPELAPYMMSFLPRLSLVLLIELFAYFFLGLYKTGLVDLKYLQNEMTTVEVRSLAMQAAVVTSDRSISDILRTSGTIDRNPSYTTTSAESKFTSADIPKILEAVKQLITSAPKA